MSRVRCLVGDPAGERARLVAGLGQDAVALHRGTGQSLADHGDLGDLVGTLERVDVGAVVGAEAHVRSVLGEQDRRVRRETLRRGDDRLQRARSRR